MQSDECRMFVELCTVGCRLLNVDFDTLTSYDRNWSRMQIYELMIYVDISEQN